MTRPGTNEIPPLLVPRNRSSQPKIAKGVVDHSFQSRKTAFDAREWLGSRLQMSTPERRVLSCIWSRWKGSSTLLASFCVFCAPLSAPGRRRCPDQIYDYHSVVANPTSEWVLCYLKLKRSELSRCSGLVIPLA